MNVTLQSIEKELNIQSIVVVVNHIENDDPFRFAQDLGNKYGVGYDDRGLVVVVGYLDHSINMSPGRSLEANLTDAECHRLEQQYVVPAMRAEMPDSGMIYLVEAVYSTLKKKELPQMSALTSVEDEKDEQLAIAVGLTMLFYFAWAIFFLRLNRKYHWVGLLSSFPIRSLSTRASISQVAAASVAAEASAVEEASAAEEVPSAEAPLAEAALHRAGNPYNPRIIKQTIKAIQL